MLPAAPAQLDEVRTAYNVKFVAEGAVYLDGGRAIGLAERMKLTVRRDGPGGVKELGEPVAELEVLSVAETSSVCEIRSVRGEIRAGDVAYLSAQDAQTLQMLRTGVTSRRYAQVVTFNEGDPLDEEVREYMPHPKLEEVNRMRGRVGFEYNSIHDLAGLNSYQTGLVFRGDLTRIGGTYWSLSGYTRGRFMAQTTGIQQQTLNDLLNRTYTLTLSYNNPKSNWTAGFGRLYIPWAASLNTVDGGYIGRRFGQRFTLATFAGTTPDPTSWNYAPNRQMAGVLGNFTGGDFDKFHYTSTFGVALTRLSWRPERQFAFFENGLFFRRIFSIYHNLEADRLPLSFRTNGAGSLQASRSFLTLRVQPRKYLSVDFSHNYFRNTPTFDPRLVATGLVDQLLFQGLSAGFRLDLPYRFTLYNSLGRNNRKGDAKASLNQMYGLTQNNIWKTGIRADVRFSRFDSAFGRGSYKAVSISRQVGETLRFELQGGQQNFASTFVDMNRARYLTLNADCSSAPTISLGATPRAIGAARRITTRCFFNLGYRF